MAGRVSALDEEPSHFVNWLQNKLRDDQSEEAGQELNSHYALRRNYGAYLKEILRISLNPSPYGAVIQTINDEVTDVKLQDGKYQISLAGEKDMIVDGVVLAHGHLLPRRICREACPECVEDPWNIDALIKIPSDSRILIVGTGQTMMDVVLLLRRQCHRGQICAISRRGLIAHLHATRETEYELKKDELPADLNSLLRYIRTATNRWVLDGGDWRAVMNSLRPHTQRLWMSFTLSEKRRFLEHLSPYWRIHRTRVSPEVWNVVQTLMLSGQLKCLAGRVQSVKCHQDCIQAVVCLRGGIGSTIMYVDRLINCSGPNYDYANSENALIRRLLDTGVIAGHPTGVGIHVAPNGAVVDRAGDVSEKMFAVGPPCKGTLFEITVIREIRRQAHEIATKLTQSICGCSIGNTRTDALAS